MIPENIGITSKTMAVILKTIASAVLNDKAFSQIYLNRPFFLSLLDVIPILSGIIVSFMIAGVVSLRKRRHKQISFLEFKQ